MKIGSMQSKDHHPYPSPNQKSMEPINHSYLDTDRGDERGGEGGGDRPRHDSDHFDTGRTNSYENGEASPGPKARGTGRSNFDRTRSTARHDHVPIPIGP